MAHKIKQYEIAGFDLIGYRQKDGTIILGVDEKNGTPMDDFPKEVEMTGNIYTLEEIKKNLPHNNIEWGQYM